MPLISKLTNKPILNSAERAEKRVANREKSRLCIQKSRTKRKAIADAADIAAGREPKPKPKPKPPNPPKTSKAGLPKNEGIKNVGSLDIFKGKINQIETSIWDAVPFCDPGCAIFKVCPHNPYHSLSNETVPTIANPEGIPASPRKNITSAHHTNQARSSVKTTPYLESLIDEFAETNETPVRCSSLCILRKRYLNSVFGTIQACVTGKKGIASSSSAKETKALTTSLSALTSSNEEFKMHIIGMMLVPLYSHLASFKIYEHSLKGSVLCGSGKLPKINPVYKEMRDTIRTILAMCRSI